MLSPLSLAPSPIPPGPSSSPRRADAADLRPGASAANNGCQCCCNDPGPAAGAAESLGPQPALQHWQAWARRSRRRCWPGGPAIAAPGPSMLSPPGPAKCRRHLQSIPFKLGFQLDCGHPRLVRLGALEQADLDSDPTCQRQCVGPDASGPRPKLGRPGQPAPRPARVRVRLGEDGTAFPGVRPDKIMTQPA
jgi:hypothetical protein